MTEHQVMEWLEKNQNQRGISHWQAVSNQHGLTSYGIGLTALRKFARHIGKNRSLAQRLWASPSYDARVLGLLIDDPGHITVEQAEEQVEQLGAGMLSHVFCSCDATLAKAPCAFELAKKWCDSQDAMRRRCGYGLVYELARKKSSGIDERFLYTIIDKISVQFVGQNKQTRLAMGNALIGIGRRNESLRQAALAVAQEISPIDFNEPGQSCAPFDVVKHLNKT
ncbi:DNA alkylation repair protein [Aestuariibacter salexigens]|uniref:DNA alkylation repair protein n=1 Tax=Aestuariibacter salexigens TaxID=226010 RepID=UPI00040D2154|nr:DNA alkylation repair protein [Aestuariibacter salexigens]